MESDFWCSSPWSQFVAWNLVVHPRIIIFDLFVFIPLNIFMYTIFGKHLLRVYHQKQLIHICLESFQHLRKNRITYGSSRVAEPKVVQEVDKPSFLGSYSQSLFNAISKEQGSWVMMNCQAKQCTCTRNFPQINHIPSGKLTYLWNITIFNMKYYYIFNPGPFSSQLC